MSWIVTAVASAAVWGAVNIVDKTLLQNYVRSHVTLQLIIGILQGATGLVFVAGFASADNIATSEAVWAVLAGFLSGFAGLLLLYMLRSQEVTRVVPITQSAPIFAAIIAFLFLDETLTIIQWLAVLVTVAGAVLISVDRDVRYQRFFLNRSFFPLIGASFIMAMGHVVSKVPLDTLSVFLVHGLRSLGISVVLLGASISNRDARDDLARLIRSRSRGLALVSFSELVLASFAFLLFLWALSEGPVGLVSALASTRSLFILLFSVTLSLRFRGLLGERMTPGVLGVKLASVTMIVVGVGAITLS